MITVNHLTKRYGSHLAVDDISFTVQDGEIVGFLGPNGAGKSTTMNMLTGYISSSSGEALINDINILDNPIQAKREIGYLPELPPLYQEIFHKENQTVVEWYFKNEMNTGSVEEFDGISLIEWTEDNKIKSLKEYGCNLNNYNPYQHSDNPQFRDEKTNWF